MKVEKCHLINIAFLFIIFTFTILQFESVRQNYIPRGDQVAFLETAIRIRETGGIIKHLPNMLTGVYREANRHPLYVALLSHFAKRTLIFFQQAKILTYFISLSFLATLILILRKQKGTIVALIVGYLFATNKYFIEHSAAISAEPLLMLCVLLGWYFVVDDFQSNLVKTRLAGISVGFAYLSKVTAVFMLPAYALVSFIRQGRRAFSKHLLLFFGMFLLVALPLLWRNMLVYRNPFYNYNSRLLLIDVGDERRTFSTLVEESPAILSYLRSHTIYQITKRIIVGMIKESVVLSQVVFWGYARIRGSIILVILFALALYRDKNRERAIFSLILSLMFFVFFSWFYQISGHYRYLLPVVFIIYFYVVGFLYQSVKNVCLWFITLAKFEWRITALLALLCFVKFVRVYKLPGFSSPISTVDPPVDFLAVKNWLKGNIGAGDRYLNGPGHDFQVEWLTGTANQSYEMPVVSDFEGLEKYLLENDF